MLRAILVDDEEPALDLLEKLLSDTGHIDIAGKFTNPQHALEWLKGDTVDIVFLDIDMPGMNGVDAAEHITEADSEIDIVFVTAYNQYAIEAFEINASDYVLKPTTAGRIRKTVERIVAGRGKRTDNELVLAEPSGSSRFYCFRRFEWIRDPNTMAAMKWRTSKERELMAYLVHHRNTFVAREKILEEVWGQSPPDQAAVYLHTCIYGIRKKLASIGCKHLLEFANNSYHLEVRGLWCDTDEFARIAGSGAGAVAPEDIGGLKQAAILYTGDYMEEDGYVWAYEAQLRCMDLYIGLMKRMAECYLATDEPYEAADCLRKALEKNPFLDDVNETLLKVYAGLGDRLSMVNHFKQFTKLMKDELGIEPLKSTVQLYSRLCRGGADEE